MATDHNFRIKNGLEVGGQLIVNSSGQLVVADVTSNLDFADNIKARFGNGADLRIYHNGSNSYIDDTGTGDLRVKSNFFRLRDTGDSYNYLTAAASGAVTLYHNGNTKLVTTSTGIDVTGRIDLDDSNTQLSSGSGNSLRIQTNSGQTEIGAQNTGWSHFYTDRPRFYFGKGLTVDSGLIGSYDEDLQIQRAGTTKLTVTTTGVDIVGDLSITGDLNTVNTTTLDVSDKVITAGVGGTAATNSGGGFKISGANVEFIWDNTNTQMTLNKDLKFTASEKLRFGNTYFNKSGDSNNVHFYAPAGFIPHSTTASSNATLGSSSYRWNGVYSNSGDFSGTITINQGGSFSKLDIKTSRTGTTDNIGGVQFYNNSNVQKSQLYGTNDGKLKLATNGTTVALTLDASQNATFAGTISSGSILATANNYQLRLRRIDNADDDWKFYSWESGLNIFPASASTVFFGRDGATTDVELWNGNLNVKTGVVKIGGTTVIDSSRNLTNIGTISSGAITSSASITASGNSNNFGNTTIAALSATSGTFSASVTASGNSNSFGNSSFGTISSGYIQSSNQIRSTHTSNSPSIWASTTDGYMQVGANGGGSSGVFGAHRETTGTGALDYTTYIGYDTYYDDGTKKWYANRTNLGRKWKTNFGGYHQNRFSISTYDGGGTTGSSLSAGWLEADWDERFGLDASGNASFSGLVNSTTYRISGTTVIDASRNLTNIGTISSGAITATNISVGNSTGNTRSVIDGSATYYSYYNTETSPRIQLGRDVGISGGAGLALGGNSSYALIGTNNTSGSAMYFKTASSVATVTTNPDMTLNSSGNLTVRGNISGVLGTFAAPNAVTGSVLITGGNTSVSANGEINSELNFGSNDGSATGNIGGSIKSVTEASNGAYVGMAFYTARQSRSPVLEEAVRISNDGNLNLKTGAIQISGTTVIDTSRNLTNIGTISSGQITAVTTADATPAIIAQNTGGVNGVIQRWLGDSDSMELRNMDSGDYELMNTQQNNGIIFRDGTGGVEIHYNGSEIVEVGSLGGLVLMTGALQIPNNLQHKDDPDTYIKFDDNRVRIVNGGTTYLDTNNGSAVLTNTTSFGGDVSGTYNAIVVADDSHNHVISNVDGLQSALDGKNIFQGSFSAGYTGDMDSLTGFRVIRSTSGSNRAFGSHYNAIQIGNTSASAYNAQIAFETGSVADGGIKFRNVGGGSYSSWHRLYSEAHKPTYTELGTMAYSNLTGTPSIPSLSGYATESYVGTQISNLVDSSPAALNTLNELAAAIGDDANFSTTVTNNIATKLPLAGGTITSGTNVGLTINHDTFGAGLRLHRNHASNASSIQFINNAGRQGTLLGIASDNGLYWQIGTSNTNNKIFHDTYHPNADKWTTSRTLTLSGEASGSTSWDGSGNATLSVTLSDSALDNQYVTIGSRYTGDGDALVVTSRASIRIWDVSTASDAPSSASDGLVLSAGWDSSSWGIQQYHDFHSNDLYLRAKNNGSMTSWDRVFHDTYHPNADKWTSSRTLTLGGDLTGNVSFDGSANFTLTATVADDSHNHVISNVDGLQTALDAALPKAGGTMTGTLALSNADSLSFESGRHWITYNDGEGNFNIRVGHKSDSNTNEVSTETGYVFHDEWSQSTGWREFNISASSISSGADVGAWRRQMYYDANSVYLAYQGSNKLNTSSAGISVNGTVTATGGNSGNWNTAYGWGDHGSEGYLTSSSSVVTNKLPLAGGSMTGALTINVNGDALNLRSTTNAQKVRITFSSDVPAVQIGHIEYTHSDGASYGSGEALILGGTESTTILADGKLMYKDGIYSKPATGTGAGTRKDENWDTAYGWGDHGSEGYLTSSSTQSKYLRSDTADTATGVITFNSTPILAGTTSLEGGELNFGAPTGGVHSAFALDNYEGNFRVHTLQSGKSFQIVGAGESQRTTINTNIGTVWGSNNDGSGSGLNADLLDDQHGSYYLNYNNFSNTPTIPTNNNQLTNGAGYITDGNTNWNNSYGFITSSDSSITNKLPLAGGELNGSLTIDVDNQSGGALRIEANQTNPEQDFYFAQEIYSTLSGSTATTTDREQGGIYMDLNSTATGGDTSHEHRVYGAYLDVDSTGDADLVYGVYSNATATPTTGQTTNVFGGYFHAEDNGGAGAVSNLYGIQSIAYSDNATSDVNAMYGGYFKAFNAADSAGIPLARAVYGEVEIAAGSGDIYGNTYVFESQYDNNTTAAPTHTAALYYGNYAGTLPTTALGVYIVDDVPNSFGGSIRTGLGSTAMTSYGFIDDLNTGMYSPANHELGFTTNGAQRLKLDANGATVTGNLAVSGTVDGVDISARNAVLTTTTTTANAALPKAGGTMTGTITASGGINMNNTNITSVNHLTFNDSGVNEGLEWSGGSGWKIFESPDALTNAAGNLQFVTGSTRKFTITTDGYIGAARTYFAVDRSTGYFYNDTSTRIAYTGGDFYIKADTGNTYLYSTNTFLGNTSGDTIHFRTNNVTATNWGISTGGDISVANKIIHNGDTDTYMSFSAADIWELHCGGYRMIKAVEASSGYDYITFGGDSGSNTGEFHFNMSSGDFHADGNVIAYSSTTSSDRKLKKNIKPIEGALEKVQNLNGVSFQWKRNDKESIGFIAQEVQEVVPEIVHNNRVEEDGVLKSESLGVDYGNITALLVEAVKEQQALINRLEERIKTLESKSEK